MNPKMAASKKSSKTLSGGTGENPKGWVKVNK